ncbi:unnamed protein product [Arctia plantaginis]|uniref:Uncharacterized protein n=1 Tax=Arctia plantaginis TaxID=874455 RepID=A0A8S0ZIW8_ARCPL|nr:unnamed protein product [Arctia plantaginis]
MLILAVVYCVISVESTKLTAIPNGENDVKKSITDDKYIDTTTTEAIDFLETVIGMIAGNYDKSMKSKKTYKCCCSNNTNQNIEKVGNSNETKAEGLEVNIKANSFNVTENNTLTTEDNNVKSDSSTYATTTFTITEINDNENKSVTTHEKETTKNEVNGNEDLLPNLNKAKE